MEVPANSRVSRWSDAPAGQPSATVTQDIVNGEKRPPSTAPEPPLKKSRLDSAQTQGGNITSTTASVIGSNSEAVNNSRSALAGHLYGTYSADQGFAATSANTGERSYSSFAPGSARGSGTGTLFFKTKICTKFKLGSCTFNDRCHFAHGVEELRKPPPGWEEIVKQGGVAFNTGVSGRSSEPPRKSNKPCRFYLEGHCPYGDRCTFSHGDEDMQRETAPTMDPSSAAANAQGRSNYKTRMCTRWEKGELCIYGDKCHFAHGQAEMRAYSGGPNYNNTGATGPSVYGDPGLMNAPPMAAPYGVPPPNHGSVGVPPPSSSANLNPYSVAGASVNSHGAQQDGNNRYTANYTYWNSENKWDGSNPAAPAPAPAPAPGAMLPPQGYGHISQATPWMSNYSADCGYPKPDYNAAPYYNPDLPQQQLPPQQQPLQQLPQQQPQPQQQLQLQPQNVAYYGSAPSYQDPSQGVNLPYNQHAAQNGDGNAYYNSNYANQQQGYTGSYNTA